MRIQVTNGVLNESSFVLIRNREVITDLSTVTHVDFVIGGNYYRSDDVQYSQYFDWSQSILYQKRITAGYIGIVVAGFNLTPGTYTGARLLVLFANNSLYHEVARDITIDVEAFT